jgi:hypothetical protein
VLNRVGTSGLRTILTEKSASHTWYAVRNLLQEIPVINRMKFHAIRTATQALHRFESLRLQDYQLEQK